MFISYEDFEKVELRCGTIIDACTFPKAKKPAFQIKVDFGDEIGIKQTSAQVTTHYTPESLIGQKVIGCVNLAPKNIAGFISEFLLVGFSDAAGAIYLASTHHSVPNGKKLH